MLENWVRNLVNVRKWVSRAWEYQQVGFDGLAMSESGVRGFGYIRKFDSDAWKCQKVWFGGL